MPPPPRILIVDDDPKIREVVRFALRKEGFETLEAGHGLEALELFGKERPALVILDILMPEMDGTEVCRELRRHSNVPIVFLSSKDEELDRILGLELGGDDYVTKPFSPRELVARVKAVCRRAQSHSPEENRAPSSRREEVLAWGDLRLDLAACRAYRRDLEVVLTAMEFHLLRALMTSPRKVFGRDELIDRAYGGEAVVSDRTIDSHIRRIRRKFSGTGCDPIETVTGFGYRMAEP
jgi:two-component system OmpR family response regulator